METNAPDQRSFSEKMSALRISITSLLQKPIEVSDSENSVLYWGITTFVKPSDTGLFYITTNCDDCFNIKTVEISDSEMNLSGHKWIPSIYSSTGWSGGGHAKNLSLLTIKL